ncbi:MAG: PAS domain-containing protein [Pseudolabrys sp.]
MKHSSIRELYDYWNARRGRRCAPARNDIDPGDIRSALADTFIVTLDQSAGHPFRIAGTRVCALFGRDLKQQAFLDLWSSGSRTMMCDLLGIVARESIGLLAGITGTGDAGDIDLELLALPLVHDGRSDARVLGALAPGCAPAWIGASAIDQLALGTFRYVGPAVLSKAAPPPLPPNGRWRRGLRVYDGGHARDKNGMLSTG